MPNEQAPQLLEPRIDRAHAVLLYNELRLDIPREFGKQAKNLLAVIDHKAAALAKRKKKPISAECSDSISTAVAPVLQAIAAGQL